MFYYNLGGMQSTSKTGNQTAGGGVTLFDIQPAYWSGTERDSNAWGFAFTLGENTTGFKNFSLLSGWAVRAGDVPEPGTLALLGAAFAAMAFARRRKPS